MSSAARIQANRNNAKRSTGPRTAEGKARSARNALKHGLAAESLVVADAEDAAAFEAFRRDWIADARPVGVIEATLAENACIAAWKLRRAARHEAAEMSFAARRAADDYDRQHRDRAGAVLRRLLNDPVDRCDNYQWRDPIIRERVEAAQAEDVAALAAELESTDQGIAMKLECWEKLASLLRDEGFWHYDARFRALKLLGRRPEDLMDDPVGQELMLACSALHPQAWALLDDAVQSAMTGYGKPVYALRVELMEERKPATQEEAMERIWKVISTEYDRLVALQETRLAPRAAVERAEAASRALLSDGPSAALRLRYEAAAERTLHRSLAELARLRKARRDADPDDDAADDDEAFAEAFADATPVPEAPAPTSAEPPPPPEGPDEMADAVSDSEVAPTASAASPGPLPARNEPNAGPSDRPSPAFPEVADDDPYAYRRPF